LRDAARTLNVPAFDVPERVASLLHEIEALTRQVDEMTQSGNVTADSLLENAEEIGDAKVVVAEMQGANPNLMRQLIDQIRQKTKASAVLLAAGQGDEKVVLVAGVSRELVDRGLSAGDWVRAVAPVVGGGGGGKPDMAQAGGKDPTKLPEALAKARETIVAKLAEDK
jgi:alanyl-tRNA synthetase